MGDGGRGTSLAQQTTPALRVGRQFGWKHLQSGVPAELGVERLPDHSHPAFPDLLEEAVMREHLARLCRHATISVDLGTSNCPASPFSLRGYYQRHEGLPVMAKSAPSLGGLARRLRPQKEYTR